jgi:hypothetical protein
VRAPQKACRRAAEHWYNARHLCCGRPALDGELDWEDRPSDAAMRSITMGHLAVSSARRIEQDKPVRMALANAERMSTIARRTLAGGDMARAARELTVALELLADADDLAARNG